MTDKELRDAAVVELKKTTQGYLKSNGDPRTTIGAQWKKGLDLLAQIGQAPPPPPPPPPPVGNPYTDINFTASKYEFLSDPNVNSQDTGSVFCAASSDPRLSSWGGLPPRLYDSRGCTTDTNMRVHIEQIGGRKASWQELRKTDGPWQTAAPDLAKSSLNVSRYRTWGSGGFAIGAERWFAFDYLFPLDMGGVSFEFVNSWHSLIDMHPSTSSQGGCIETKIEPWSGNPRYHTFLTTPNSHVSGGERYVNLLQLTTANGLPFAASYNVWHEIVIGIKVSNQGTVGNSPGWVEVWHDGAQVMAREQRPNVLPGESGPYMQMQNYTSYPTNFVGGATRGAMVYGGFRAGMTRADVQTR